MIQTETKMIQTNHVYLHFYIKLNALYKNHQKKASYHDPTIHDDGWPMLDDDVADGGGLVVMLGCKCSCVWCWVASAISDLRSRHG